MLDAEHVCSIHNWNILYSVQVIYNVMFEYDAIIELEYL